MKSLEFNETFDNCRRSPHNCLTVQPVYERKAVFDDIFLGTSVIYFLSETLSYLKTKDISPHIYGSS